MIQASRNYFDQPEVCVGLMAPNVKSRSKLDSDVKIRIYAKMMQNRPGIINFGARGEEL